MIHHVTVGSIWTKANGIIMEEFEDWDKILFETCLCIEFLREEFDNEERVESGCSLHVLHAKLYYLFKDLDWYGRISWIE